MADTTDPTEIRSPSPTSERRSGRTLLPRFGLRSLFVFALLFCLVFGWIGRNAYRMRQEDAAIEALKRADATINMQHERDQGDMFTISLDGTEPPPPTPPSHFARMIEWSNRLPIRAVRLPGSRADEGRLAAAIDAFDKLPEIERIVLVGSGLDDRAMPAIAKVSGLKELVLDDTGVTGEGLATLAPHVRLRRLSVSDPYQRQGEVCSGVARFPDLEKVELSSTEMSREDVEGLASLLRLEELALWGIRRSGGDGTRSAEKEGAFYAPLARAKRLKTLQTGGIGMSDAEVGALADLPLLETLYIDGIGDAGLARLAALPKLKFLRVTSPVTREAARSYSAQRPECRVFYWVQSDDPFARFRPGAVIDPNAERSEYYQAGAPEED